MTLNCRAIGPKDIAPEAFVERIAKIATRAWRGFNTNTLAWRRDYYGKIAGTEAGKSGLRIFEVSDDWGTAPFDYGFVTILPMRPVIAKLHLEGRLNQYDFETAWLETDVDRAKSFHYFQSLFIDESVLSDFGLHRIVLDEIRSMLRLQGCGRGGRPFAIYAEIGYDDGRRVADRHGLQPMPKPSFFGNEMMMLDSEAPTHPNAQRALTTIADIYSD